jgi:hypothetical protein
MSDGTAPGHLIWQAARKTKLTFRQSFLRHFSPEQPQRKTRRLESAGFLTSHGTGQGPQYLKVARSALSFILTTAKIIVKNPPA